MIKILVEKSFHGSFLSLVASSRSTRWFISLWPMYSGVAALICRDNPADVTSVGEIHV